MEKNFSALSGWYQLNYPSDWQFEIDCEGRYNFYNPNLGLGVLKISSYSTTDDSKLFDPVQEVDTTCESFFEKKNGMTYFQSETGDKQAKLHFWITEKNQVKIFCTYTIDKFLLSEEENVKNEMTKVNEIMNSLEFCS